MALSGTLETFSLPDVLRLLASTNKQGRLSVSGDRGTGEVWTDDGSITSARSDRGGCADVHGVVFDLLRYRTGEFAFEACDDLPAPADGAGPVDQVLERAEVLLQEWTDIESVVPSLDIYVRMVAEVSEAATVTVDRWKVLAAVGSGARAEQVADSLELGEFDACKALHGLILDGLVEIAEPEPGVETDTGAPEATTFETPGFAAGSIGAPGWEPPERLGPDAVTDDPWAEPDEAGPEIDEPAATLDAGGDLTGEETVDDLTIVDVDEVLDLGHGVPDLDEHTSDPESDADLDDGEPAGLGSLAGWDDDEDLEPPAAADEQDDFLSQLSNLSPKAAAAIEAVENGEDTTDRADAVAEGNDDADDGHSTAPVMDDEPEKVSGGNLLSRFLSATQHD